MSCILLVSPNGGGALNPSPPGEGIQQQAVPSPTCTTPLSPSTSGPRGPAPWLPVWTPYVGSSNTRPRADGGPSGSPPRSQRPLNKLFRPALAPHNLLTNGGGTADGNCGGGPVAAVAALPGGAAAAAAAEPLRGMEAARVPVTPARIGRGRRRGLPRATCGGATTAGRTTQQQRQRNARDKEPPDGAGDACARHGSGPAIDDLGAPSRPGAGNRSSRGAVGARRPSGPGAAAPRRRDRAGMAPCAGNAAATAPMATSALRGGWCVRTV